MTPASDAERMKLIKSDRCPRECCNKAVRSKYEKAAFAKYGYCSFHCHEWHRLEKASAFVRSMPRIFK